MDSRAVNSDVVFSERVDLFGIHGRTRCRNLASSDLAGVRFTGNLFRHEKIFSGGGFEFYFILRCVVDTRLAIGA